MLEEDNAESFTREYSCFAHEIISARKAQSTLCCFMQTNYRPRKTISNPKAGHTKTIKKQTRRECLPEQPQHIEEMNSKWNTNGVEDDCEFMLKLNLQWRSHHRLDDTFIVTGSFQRVFAFNLTADVLVLKSIKCHNSNGWQFLNIDNIAQTDWLLGCCSRWRRKVADYQLRE